MAFEMKQPAGLRAEEGSDLTHSVYSHKSIPRGEAIGSESVVRRYPLLLSFSRTGSSGFTGE
jgi:hypothetical protein